MGSNFSKELPGQESKAEIILNAKPSCWVLSQRPLCRPEKVARIREIGAGEELIDLCLRKAAWPISLAEIINQLATDNFRQVYVHLDGKVQQQIEVLITPPTLLSGLPRKQRAESEIWKTREQIHKLKTEPIDLGKTRTRRTWKKVTEVLHAQGLLLNKTQNQIYWTLKDKRENPNLSPEDKKLLEEMFGRTERGKIKQQVDEMADAIELARVRLSWEETHKTLLDFFGWTGTLQQLMGAYARIRVEREKAQSAQQPAETAEARRKRRPHKSMISQLKRTKA
jgi:hypothetical protein